MTVHVVTHEACLGHQMAPGHPERPERLLAVRDALREQGGLELTWHEAPEATHEQLLRVHPEPYLDRIREACEAGGARLDPDTSVGPASWAAVVRAAGGAVTAVRLALEHSGNVFVAVRPPGHHAEASRAMGFCIFGNAVIAARYALEHFKVERILIVDWDVHHGNGTQSLVEQDERIRFVSIHQWPLYPGTGRAEERGVGNVWNLPRPPGLPPQRYRDDLWAAIGSATETWVPELVLVSAGFDSMAGDPLGGFTLEASHLADLSGRLCSFDAPVVALLEGGYRLANLSSGTLAVVANLG